MLLTNNITILGGATDEDVAEFITAGVAGVMALGIAVSAWAAEPQITDQKIRSGGVTVNIPVVKGAVGGAEV